MKKRNHTVGLVLIAFALGIYVAAFSYTFKEQKRMVRAYHEYQHAIETIK